MPKKAGRKLCTPLIESYSSWLLNDIERSPRTVRGYRDAVEFFAASLHDTGGLERVAPALSCPNEERYVSTLELVDWAAVTLKDCEAFVRRPMLDGRPASQSTRRRRAYGLKAFFDYLEMHGDVPSSPAAHLRGPGVQIRKPRPIADDVWLAIWDQPMSPDDRVMLGLGYYVGLRRHEMIAIGPQHFDLARRRVANFPRKGGKVNEVVYGANLDIIARKLPRIGVRLDDFEDSLGMLVGMRSGSGRLLALTEHVSVDDHSDNSINRRLTALSVSCGVHVTPHQMRHSFGTNLLRAGVPAIVVADQMAHANLETTRGYLDTTQWYEMQETEGLSDRP